MKKVPIFNSLISIGSYQNLLDEIFWLVRNRLHSYVCFANVHMLVEAVRNNEFRKVVNDADMVMPDGRPLSIFLKLFEGIPQARACGMDMLPDVLRRAEQLNKSVYFYGATDELLNVIVQKAKREFSLLRIAGFYAPPFKSSFSREESEESVSKINEASPDLVLVALGCPKQEKWMAENKHRINACLLGLGQAFSVYAGVEKRLPKWMRNLSLEWVYRLWTEPARLWKRYAYTNSLFLLLVARHVMTRSTRNLFLNFRNSLFAFNKPAGSRNNLDHA